METLTVPLFGICQIPHGVADPLVSGGVAIDHRGLADEAQCLRRLRGLLHRDQGRQVFVGLELLLDAGELHQLLGELVGVERIERVLVLQLGRQQGQEALEVSGERAAVSTS